MPFFGINPQTVRLTASPGATNSPTATTNGSAPLNNIVDTATAQNLPGMVAWYKDTQGQLSVLAYAIAQASIAYASPLMHAVAGSLSAATGVASTAVKSGLDLNCVAVMQSSAAGYPAMFAGIAAASVINTGAYFWRYISGFVPEALCGSGMASMRMIIPRASGTLVVMASLNAENATYGTSFFGTTQIPVGFSVGAAPANGGLASICLTGWYM